MKKLATGCAIAMAFSMLGGCAGPAIKVTDITKDKQAYLAKNFSPDKLSPDVTGQLKHTNLPYKKMTAKFDLTTHKINSATTQDKDIQDTVVNQMENVGNGYLRVINETASNDVPFASSLILNYLGFLTVSIETVTYSQPYAPRITNVDKITHVEGDLLNPQEGATYSVDETAAGSDDTFTCQAGKSYPAKNLLAKLEGEALDLSCEFSRQGIVLTKSKMVFLKQYGTYLVVETDGTTYSNVFKLTDLTTD